MDTKEDYGGFGSFSDWPKVTRLMPGSNNDSNCWSRGSLAVRQESASRQAEPDEQTDARRSPGL